MGEGGVKGSNTYQIVHKGASGVAMDGAGIRARESHFALLSIEEGGQKQPPFYCDVSCSHIFCDEGPFFFIIWEAQHLNFEYPVQRMY